MFAFSPTNVTICNAIPLISAIYSDIGYNSGEMFVML